MVNPKKNDIYVSFVIPAYNAEIFIERNLSDLYKILSKLGRPFEIICVVDGATDDTYKKALEVKRNLKNVEVFNYKVNKGKGYAVRFGMKKAKGEIIGFVDAGLDLDYKSILDFLDLMREGRLDCVIGSKRHPKSIVNYPYIRKVFSWGYQFYVKILFGLPINDTQVGMKIFRRQVILKLLPILTIDGFAFDIEVLLLANKLLKARIVEAPIRVNLDQRDSTIKIMGIKFIKDLVKVFWDTLKIYYRFTLGRYHF